MDVTIDKNRVRTTSAYNPRMLKALPYLEGQKRWGANRSFSFENTHHNLQVWRSVFPEAKVAGLNADAAAESIVEAFSADTRGRPTFEYRTQPRAHQARGLEKINSKVELPEVFGLFMDIGTGKSWMGINIMGQRWCEGKIDAVLLIAKNGVHSQWVKDEIPKHMSQSVNYKCWIWDKTKKGERDYEEFRGFEGLKIFAINIDAIITTAGYDRIMNFIMGIGGKRMMMIVDESQDIKNISASRTQQAIKIGHLIKYRMIMTGTPIAKNLVDAFSQFKFLHEMIFGHKYVTTFRAKFCVLRDNGFGLEIVGHKNVEEFYRTVEPHIFRITAPEVLGLLPPNYVPYHFVLTDEQKRLIKELKKEFSASLEGDVKISSAHAAAAAVKIQQVTCGFAVDENGNTVHFKNPRMDALKNVIEQTTGKIIIWCRFNEDIRMIMKELGEEAVHYYGETKPKDREANKNAFLDPNSKVRFFVASPEAAGTGLNLQGVCRTNIYYSNSFNSLGRWQSEGRTWRDGTTGLVTYIDLIAKGGIDANILNNLRNKKSISSLALDEMRKLILEENDEIIQPREAADQSHNEGEFPGDISEPAGGESRVENSTPTEILSEFDHRKHG